MKMKKVRFHLVLLIAVIALGCLAPCHAHTDEPDNTHNLEQEQQRQRGSANKHAGNGTAENEGRHDPTPDVVSSSSSRPAEDMDSSAPQTTPTSEGRARKPTRRESENEDFDIGNTDWGSYYDPQNVFCGKFDCYKILGFDYESFGRSPPDTKTITKRYRSLSREWHPDKNKRRDAKARFVKIARAYEVLTSKTLRKEYDDMRYDQELYFQKYGTNILWQYAPKSDTTIVILIILLIANVASWFTQKHRWQMVADRLVKAAVEDWTPSMGGTPESKQLREEALAVLAERGGTDMNGSDSSTYDAGKKSKGPKKVSAKEKKRLEQEAILPIIRDMVSQMHDFGAGFHKPTWRDLFIVGLAKMPYKISKEGWWLMRYWVRRLQKLPLSESERQVLTERAVGPIAWESASDEERSNWVSRELWVVANLAAWSEEQEFNKRSAGEKKQYLYLKKKGLLEKED
jgi:curved DNA-binding protein CbpA